MSYYKQQNRRKLSVGEDGNALVMLIAINLVVFVIFSIIKLVYFAGSGSAGVNEYETEVLRLFTLPAEFPVFLSRPWTLFTHFILHNDVWHIIANMIWLWCFGYILQDLTGNRKLIPIFIYGALAGGIAYMLAFNFVPALEAKITGTNLLGASGGVMAIAIATTATSPNYRIFRMINGGIPIWVITVLYVIIDLATIPYNNPGGHIAHLAGAAMGLLVVYMLRRGYDWSDWMNGLFDWANGLFDPDKPKKGKTIRSQQFYKSNIPPFRKKTNLSQQRIDEILDKINQRGYSSLTQEEKDILRRASKEDL
jgi:membrane associated rhomboid family serine protease